MTSETDRTVVSEAPSLGGQASVVVAVVIFSIRPAAGGRPRLEVLLVRRGVEPFAGQWSLPGGKLWGDEALDEAAWRQLAEKTALRASYLEQLYTFELCDSSGQIEAAVVAYYALVRTDGTEIAAGRKTMEAAWYPVDGLPRDLAFDNDEVLQFALQRLRNKVEYALVAFQFLPAHFTMAQLRAVYEVILGRRIDPTNFRRRVEATDSIVPTGSSVSGGRHRPPALYRCADPAALVKTLRPGRALRSSRDPLPAPIETA
ncbi:MAG TPA: NUDIX domain-containing protein [Candidatus Binatia bacterium]|nr:NUDIX domain-containing protein [Candidatus Binatia bacterium]